MKHTSASSSFSPLPCCVSPRELFSASLVRRFPKTPVPPGWGGGCAVVGSVSGGDAVVCDWLCVLFLLPRPPLPPPRPLPRPAGRVFCTSPCDLSSPLLLGMLGPMTGVGPLVRPPRPRPRPLSAPRVSAFILPVVFPVVVAELVDAMISERIDVGIKFME
jgi:hypothetical protein